TGGVTLNAGALTVQSGNSLGTGALRMSGGTTLTSLSSGTFANALAIAGQATVVAGAGQSITWNGQIADNGSAGTLNLNGGGTFALTNASNTYSGGTVVTGNSTIAVSSDGALGSGALQLGDASSSATLALSGSFLSGRSIGIGNLGATIDT